MSLIDSSIHFDPSWDIRVTDTSLRDGSHHRLSIRLSNDLLICSIVTFCSLGAAQANAPSWLRLYDAKPLRCALAYSQLPHCG